MNIISIQRMSTFVLIAMLSSSLYVEAFSATHYKSELKSTFAQLSSFSFNPRDLEKNQVAIKTWDDLVQQVAQFIQKESKNLIGQKDTIIINALATVLKTHNDLLNMIADVNTWGVKDIQQNQLREHGQLFDKAIRLESLIQTNNALQKLKKSRSTLARKVQAIDVLEAIAHYISRFAVQVKRAYLQADVKFIE